MYEQYEKFLLQSTLDCMDDMTYCPRETCQSVVLVDTDAEKLGRCPACKFVFCVFCKVSIENNYIWLRSSGVEAIDVTYNRIIFEFNGRNFAIDGHNDCQIYENYLISVFHILHELLLLTAYIPRGESMSCE